MNVVMQIMSKIRTKTLISSPIISDSEDTSSDVGCSGRFAVWRLRCDARIAKERLRRQIRRSKTHVEGHVCYPWLRRLFFHLSHYFPNLHTTRNPAQRMNTRGGINVKRTGTGGVQQSTGKTQKLNTNGRRAEQIISAGQPSIIVVQANPLSESHSPYNSSPQTSPLSGNESRRKSLSPNSNRPQEKRVTSNPKRRPLQRQKISDTPDFDQFFTRSEFALGENKFSTAIPSTYAASSTRDLDQDSFVARRTFEYKPESTSHRNPRDHLINSSTQESMGQEEQTFPITRAKSRSKTSSSRQPPVSPRISGRRGPGIAALQLQNSDSQASSSLDPSNIWSEMPDLYDNEVTSPINSQAGPPLLNSQSRVHMSSTTRSVGPRAQPYLAPGLIKDLKRKGVGTNLNTHSRRGDIYHICSGEANFEPPPAHMFQPRSFDSPIPMGMFESQKACSLIASPRRAIHRQLQCCSQQSSDSPQLILPSFTVDSTDDVLPYRMGESLEQQDSRPKGGAGNISYSPNAEDINYHGTYRRYSDNPTGHTRHTPQASISIESGRE
ncbi:hypothetical protein FGIG_07905 [Fasciola gigantica]|uniref:Uncharacterized protein n=1 Tax=Fasciola gigantica TaxID=46835 RepID=A0A504ZBH2_FASGI|nr:hypothetical protein FGIG_07905 [Fasciola gigantica]